jgi:hypothetical protein
MKKCDYSYPAASSSVIRNMCLDPAEDQDLGGTIVEDTGGDDTGGEIVVAQMEGLVLTLIMYLGKGETSHPSLLTNLASRPRSSQNFNQNNLTMNLQQLNKINSEILTEKEKGKIIRREARRLIKIIREKTGRTVTLREILSHAAITQGFLNKKQSS